MSRLLHVSLHLSSRPRPKLTYSMERRLLSAHPRKCRHRQFSRPQVADGDHPATGHGTHRREHGSGGGQGQRRHSSLVPVLAAPFGRRQRQRQDEDKRQFQIHALFLYGKNEQTPVVAEDAVGRRNPRSLSIHRWHGSSFFFAPPSEPRKPPSVRKWDGPAVLLGVARLFGLRGLEEA